MLVALKAERVKVIYFNTRTEDGLIITRPGKGGAYNAFLLSRLPEELEKQNLGHINVSSHNNSFW